jgi:hypothetical protein
MGRPMDPRPMKPTVVIGGVYCESQCLTWRATAFAEMP